MKHVLIIDDDASIRDLLTEFLSQHSFRVTGVPEIRHLQRILATDTVDLFLVDLNIGGEDGLELVRRLSANAAAPVIILSGERLDEVDKVVGLELGASDYITKPFGIRELLARIRNALRDRTVVQPESAGKTYVFGEWNLSLKTRRLTHRSTGEVKLSAAEFNLLVAFLNAPRQPLSRAQLLSSSRVHDEEVFDRSVDVQVLRLRRKLEKDPSNPQLLKTERGVGYFFNSDVEVTSWPRRLASPQAPQQVRAG